MSSYAAGPVSSPRLETQNLQRTFMQALHPRVRFRRSASGASECACYAYPPNILLNHHYGNCTSRSFNNKRRVGFMQTAASMLEQLRRSGGMQDGRCRQVPALKLFLAALWPPIITAHPLSTPTGLRKAWAELAPRERHQEGSKPLLLNVKRVRYKQLLAKE